MESSSQPLKPRFFYEVRTLYLGHIATSERELGVTAIHDDSLLDFREDPKPYPFEEADAIELRYIVPPNEFEQSPFMRIAIALLREDEPYMLREDREQYDAVSAIARQVRGDDIPLEEEGLYVTYAAPEGDPFIVNQNLLDDALLNQAAVARQLLDTGLAREPDDAQLTTLLELIASSKPDPENFIREFTQPD